ncbi:hypothetical protein XELAEV_18043790mg [Xenopus laevis]|uniref:Uncharacterized protein n=1 Tax=Xenopus laevis TaxID=8355 RepID=A0A974H358_XENLA|nr:hypothetical protein XELAEV_18043790mg [Xenopus laevis]
MTQTGARTVSPSMLPFPPMLRSFRGWRGSSRLGCHQVLESTMDGHLGLPNLSMDLGHLPPHPEFLAALLMEHRLHGSHHCDDEPQLCHRLITQSPFFLLWWSPNGCSTGSSTIYNKNQI